MHEKANFSIQVRVQISVLVMVLTANSSTHLNQLKHKNVAKDVGSSQSLERLNKQAEAVGQLYESEISKGDSSPFGGSVWWCGFGRHP